MPADQAEALETIAGVDEVSVNEEIQRAIAAHIEARRSDPDFQRRLKASLERNREILERLARRRFPSDTRRLDVALPFDLSLTLNG